MPIHLEGLDGRQGSWRSDDDDDDDGSGGVCERRRRGLAALHDETGGSTILGLTTRDDCWVYSASRLLARLRA